MAEGHQENPSDAWSELGAGKEPQEEQVPRLSAKNSVPGAGPGRAGGVSEGKSSLAGGARARIGPGSPRRFLWVRWEAMGTFLAESGVFCLMF